MQNNLRNRSVALASTFALALTGIVATAPAANANAGVDLGPTTGTNTGAFITDEFSMDIDVNAPNSPARLAIKIDNPSLETISFEIPGVSKVTVRAFNATGQPVSVDADRFHTGSAAATVVAGNVTNKVVTDIAQRAVLVANDTVAANDVASFILTDLTGPDNAAIGSSDDELVLKLRVQETSNTAFRWGKGNQGDVSVTSWVEIEAGAGDFTTVDSATASATATVKWYDPAGVSVIPSIERFADTNGALKENDAAAFLAGKVRFIRPDLNLNQVDLGQWDLSVRDTAGNVMHAASVLSDDVEFLDGTKDNADTAGAVYFETATDNALTSTSSYTVRIEHRDANVLNTRSFNSTGFTPASSTTNYSVFATVTDSTNAGQDSTAPTGVDPDNGTVDGTVTLRPGTESFTYKARLYDTDGTQREKDASQTVVAEVTASYLATGETLNVSGTSTVLSKATQSAVVVGLTNSDGDFSVTVTSSDASTLTEYTVQFFTIGDNGVFDSLETDSSDSAILTATYTAADVDGTGLTVANTVLSGDTVTINATVKDTFGVVTNADGTKALYLTVQGTDTADLDETVAVAADGTASISFANYVATGQSDLVNVFLHTGTTYSSTNQVDSEVASLYNPGDVAAVNAPASVTGNVTYDDFIVGSASSTNVAPDDAAMSVTGTVVDANGQGVPGAVVTVDAAGMQLRQSGVGAYAQDSITFAASAAGTFTVDMWSHVLSPTGVDLTITSGGQSATTTVKTYLPTGLSGGNLVFSIDAPANIDVNKTYAIQASLTDKWDNPVKTSGGTVDIVGIGSVEINSASAGATDKNFGSDGKVTVFVRSIKDIEGPGTISATLQTGAVYSTSATATDAVDRTEVLVDVAGTAHDETSFSNEIEFNINVGEAAATSSDQKVNAGSFKGYVALYAKGYEGQRMSAIVAGKWLQVDSLASNFERVVRFTGAGYDIKVRIYIDGEQVGPEFDILTK